MRIGGFLKTSYSDFPGEVSSVIFTSGCNFKCPYCHNGDLASGKPMEDLDQNQIIETLKMRRQHIRAVVVSGGEPTLQPDLIDFIKALKNLGFKVKLDTNGSRPQVLKDILQAKLLDYIAMDLKGCLEDYESITSFGPEDHLLVDRLKESVDCIKGSGVDHEFRTTILSPYHNQEVLTQMLETLNGCDKWYLQQYQYSDNQLMDIHYDTYDHKMLVKFKKHLEDRIEKSESLEIGQISIRAKV